MKVKTSITLSEDILEAMDQQSALHKNRSEFIESAIRAYLAQLHREKRDTSDSAILNQHADRLNAEAAEVLAFQVEP